MERLQSTWAILCCLRGNSQRLRQDRNEPLTGGAPNRLIAGSWPPFGLELLEPHTRPVGVLGPIMRLMAGGIAVLENCATHQHKSYRTPRFAGIRALHERSRQEKSSPVSMVAGSQLPRIFTDGPRLFPPEESLEFIGATARATCRWIKACISRTSLPS
jgi:hypothetical protein